MSKKIDELEEKIEEGKKIIENIEEVEKKLENEEIGSLENVVSDIDSEIEKLNYINELFGGLEKKIDKKIEESEEEIDIDEDEILKLENLEKELESLLDQFTNIRDNMKEEFSKDEIEKIKKQSEKINEMLFFEDEENENVTN